MTVLAAELSAQRGVNTFTDNIDNIRVLADTGSVKYHYLEENTNGTFITEFLGAIGIEGSKYVVITTHRAINQANNQIQRNSRIYFVSQKTKKVFEVILDSGNELPLFIKDGEVYFEIEDGECIKKPKGDYSEFKDNMFCLPKDYGCHEGYWH